MAQNDGQKNLTPGFPGGESIPFRQGFANFGKWSQATYSIDGLKGANTDFGLAYDAIAEEYGLSDRGAARDLLREMNVAPHHVEDGLKIQLIPSDLHDNVPLIGGASRLRKGG